MKSRIDPCLFLLHSEKALDSRKSEAVALTTPQCPFDGGEWLLPRSKEGVPAEGFEATEGRLLLLTDDIAESGNRRHRRLIEKLRERFKFGKYKSLK